MGPTHPRSFFFSPFFLSFFPEKQKCLLEFSRNRTQEKFFPFLALPPFIPLFFFFLYFEKMFLVCRVMII